MISFALIATAPHISPAHIAALEGILAGTAHGPAIPLATGEAYEWPVKLAPEQCDPLMQQVRDAIADAPIDTNLVANDVDRRKRMLIADMDSTIIEQECIDEIADLAGVGAKVAAITERAMRGELDFEQALTTRVALLQGLPLDALRRVLTERLTIMPGARQLVATMAANGAYCALVSGGFTYFTSRIGEQVGFHENQANTLEIKDHKLTGHPIPPILGRQAKLDALNDITTRRHIPLVATLAVGDGANDLAMIEAAGLGVAYHAKPVVAAKADAQIVHSDLTALLYLQGYHRSEFVYDNQ